MPALGAQGSTTPAPASGGITVRSSARPSLRPPRIFLPRRQNRNFLQQSSAAGGTENVPGFGGGLSAGVKIGRGDNKSAIKPEDVVIESEAGIDYEPLRSALEAGRFQEADGITRALLIKLAGEGAKERGWVYFTEVGTISAKDMKTMDDLWRAYSEGKFGFSVQKAIFNQAGKRWATFFQRISWVQGENNVYRKWPGGFIYDMSAEKGHLPLTNALRGTELITAIFDHPAFAFVEEKTRPKGGQVRQVRLDSTSL